MENPRSGVSHEWGSEHTEAKTRAYLRDTFQSLITLMSFPEAFTNPFVKRIFRLRELQSLFLSNILSVRIFMFRRFLFIWISIPLFFQVLVLVKKTTDFVFINNILFCNRARYWDDILKAIFENRSSVQCWHQQYFISLDKRTLHVCLMEWQMAISFIKLQWCKTADDHCKTLFASHLEGKLHQKIIFNLYLSNLIKVLISFLLTSITIFAFRSPDKNLFLDVFTMKIIAMFTHSRLE